MKGLAFSKRLNMLLKKVCEADEQYLRVLTRLRVQYSDKEFPSLFSAVLALQQLLSGSASSIEERLQRCNETLHRLRYGKSRSYTSHAAAKQ